MKKSSATTQQQSFRYDRSGNRVVAGTGSTTVLASFAAANQLQRVGGAGSTMVEGEIDKGGTVSINGQAASVASVPGTGKWQFWKQVPVQEGNNTLSITATNANGGAASTKNYSITVSGVATQYAYDGNGNTTDVKDATGAVLRHYEWDTLSRLLAIQEGATPAQGAHRTEFSYDGAGRRVRQVEKTGNGTAWVQASNNTFLWVGMELCEQRDATGGIVQRNYYGEGEERLETGTSQKYYYTHDHLGSVREVVDSTGTLVARYDYDVWGKRTQLSGTFVCERGFTGHWHHAWSNLIVAPFRVYDSDVGRWLSEDPIGERGGLNLYKYVGNKTLRCVDTYGLWQVTIFGGDIAGAYLTFGNNGGSGFLNGQWNVGLAVGLGEGVSASLDTSDSGIRCHGGGVIAKLAGSLGVGVAGVAGEFGYEGDNHTGALTGMLAGRIGRNSGIDSARLPDGGDLQLTGSPGWTNMGESAFGGFGASYVW